MDTPIADFVGAYADASTVRLHMPGHKGRPVLGCEAWDITEVHGADSLYEAQGIIAQSEANASQLFGTAQTFYSTEGSSQVIRAMITMVACSKKDGRRPWFLAARNAHKAFLYALALVDADVTWLWPDTTDSICSCAITAQQVQQALQTADYPPAAVYLTSPDYLGNQQPIAQIAKICHQYGTLLIVDNAHGAYLRFLPESQHPIDLGADLCCDSAHKTLPVLTGGAYLHISKHAPAELLPMGKQVLNLYGSTSPSYLTLASLDLCNAYLGSDYPSKLRKVLHWIQDAKEALARNGWSIVQTEPMKITICGTNFASGVELAQSLRKQGIECEYADQDFLVLMPSAETQREELLELVQRLGENKHPEMRKCHPCMARPEQACSIRQAVFSPSQMLPVEDSLGRIAATPTVSCPPAVPMVVSGEIIDEQVQKLLHYYGIDAVAVVKE